MRFVELPNVHLHFTVDKEDPVWEGRVGYPDIDWIKAKIEDLSGFVFYLCGPRVMVDKVENSLEKEGIDKNNMKIDHW